MIRTRITNIDIDFQEPLCQGLSSGFSAKPQLSISQQAHYDACLISEISYCPFFARTLYCSDPCFGGNLNKFPRTTHRPIFPGYPTIMSHLREGKSYYLFINSDSTMMSNNKAIDDRSFVSIPCSSFTLLIDANIPLYRTIGVSIPAQLLHLFCPILPWCVLQLHLVNVNPPH